MTEPVCSRCKDTHRMTANDRSVPCTGCPTPCASCAVLGIGAYCATTPCACACHTKEAPADTTWGPISVRDVGAFGIARRAGVDLAQIEGADPATLLNVIRALLEDGVREDKRWTARVKLLEGRIDNAVDMLRGVRP